MEIKNFIQEHPDWEELLSADPYNLKISRDSPYIMFKYNQLSSDFSLPLVREARGIIFREDTWECVCHAFDKFGNYGESYCPEIDWTTASVQEKVDGSIQKIWHDRTDHSWHLSTNGMINAWKTETGESLYSTFGKLFEKALEKYGWTWETFTMELNPCYTYMFELVSPYNRVVIPYEDFGLYLIGLRDMKTGNEVTPPQSFYNFDTPKRYPLKTLKDVQAAAAALPWTEEGFVVCDDRFNRVKIKSEDWVKAHYARTNGNISTRRLLEIILANEVEEFLIYASDYKDKIEEIRNSMQAVATDAIDALNDLHGYAPPESKGEYAKLVKKYPKIFQDFLFKAYGDNLFWMYAKDWDANKWLKILRTYIHIEEDTATNDE